VQITQVHNVIFSERELTFTFAICYRRSVCRLSLCLSSLTFVRPTQPVEIFGNIFRRLVPWLSVDIHGKFYEDRPKGTPPLGGLNAKGVAKQSDFEALGRHTLETVRDRR